MMVEMIGGFEEVQEEAIGVFTLKVIEPRHRGWVKEPVEKSTALSPSVPVFHHGEIPRGMSHP